LSRVGKQPIKVPEGVDVHIDQNMIKVKSGDKSLQQEINPSLTMDFNAEQREILVKRTTENKYQRALHGLYRSLLSNMVIGVTDGFKKKLEIVGVGYRAEIKGNTLVLSLGYSHQILFKPPAGIQIVAPTLTIIEVSGIDKQLVGQVAAKIRSFRPPEPYKGKGIKYEGEFIRRKAGKTAA
jgi:large subunit ribosomal protein L6